MKIVSFFAGAGGLDLGFQKAGFNVVWANEYDKDIWETYESNHSDTYLCKKSITDVEANEVPDCDGIIGGPPCQSWSEAGALRGIGDKRGQLFFDFIRILDAKKPKFFLAENVSGMLLSRHSKALDAIKQLFKECGYSLSFRLVNANDYNVPQDRQRVFFVGFRNDLNVDFEFPEPFDYKPLLKDCIKDLENDAIPAKPNNHTNGDITKFHNNEYMIGGFSTMFMSRNRVRSWDEPSFTIQAGGRHAPIHPSAPKMKFVSQDVRVFEPNHEHIYRRLSVRECARIQTFPDDFVFKYKNLTSAYKMIGNAVPVNLGFVMANAIKKTLQKATTNNKNINASLGDSIQKKMTEIIQQSNKLTAIETVSNETVIVGYYKSSQLEWIEKNNLYNLRFEKKLNCDDFTNARYLLLHGENELLTKKLFEISTLPSIMNKKDLINTGYQNPSCEKYLVYKLNPICSSELLNTSWDIKLLVMLKKISSISKPFIIGFQDLDKVKVV